MPILETPELRAKRMRRFQEHNAILAAADREARETQGDRYCGMAHHEHDTREDALICLEARRGLGR